jgi:alkanesulfonate monooxygenase SsuD/methylene tetrahydromethanopterin reductase-like flavin-dependent oxidoreductase (luciferase family)
MAATVDHLSGGRLEFGLGAAWNEREHRMFGIDLGTPGHQIDRMREALIVLRSLWTQPSTTFLGRHYRLQDAVCAPSPIQRPHPPIWIGGTGERKTLRVVAEMADAWNAFRVSPEEGGRLSGVLDGHCADVGRDPAAIRRTIQVGLNVEDPAATVAEIEAFCAQGFSEAIVSIRAPEAKRAALIASEVVLPALRQVASG